MAVDGINKCKSARKAGGIPTRFGLLSVERRIMRSMARDGPVEPVSRDQILRRERGLEKWFSRAALTLPG